MSRVCLARCGLIHIHLCIAISQDGSGSVDIDELSAFVHNKKWADRIRNRKKMHDAKKTKLAAAEEDEEAKRGAEAKKKAEEEAEKKA